MEKEKKTYPITCKQCGCTYNAYKEKPLECGICRSKAWDKDIKSREYAVPVPKVDHSEAKRLPFVGARCPYCGGTTGMDTFRILSFCYSCDASFDVSSGIFKGVVQGIGLRR